MKPKEFARRVIATSLAVAGLTAAAPAFAQNFNDALKTLIADAGKEGKLILGWSNSGLGGVQGARRAQDEMNRMFGTNIKIDFLPGPDMARVANQIMTEFSAGQKAHVDIILGAATQLAPMVKLGVLRQIDWRSYMPERITAEMSELDGRVMRVVTGLTGATYNSALAPSKPERLEDFLRPEWKGRVASTPYAAGFDVLVADDVWGEAKTYDYVRKLTKQISGLIRCGDAERIATGEYLALVMDCTGQDSLVWKEKGAPIDQMLPLDAAQKRYYYFGIPKNAPYPAAATLYSLYLMTPEGQKMAFDTWKTDLHLFPESQMAKVTGEFEKKGVQYREITMNWWMQHPEIDQKRAELIKIITTKE